MSSISLYRSIALLTFWIVSSTSLWGQEYAVSKEIQLRPGDNYLFVGSYRDTFLTVKETDGEINLLAFGPKLDLGWNRQLLNAKQRFELVDVVPSKEYFTMICVKSAAGTTTLRGIRATHSGGIDSLFDIAVFDGRKNTLPETFVLSEDKSQCLFYDLTGSYGYDVVSYNLREMRLNWRKTFQSTYDESSEDFHQAIINNKGEVFLTFSKNNRKSKREEAHFKVVQLNEFDGQIVRIGLNGNLWYQNKFIFDNQHYRLVCGGLYSVKTADICHGSYYISVNPRQPDSSAAHFDIFPIDFLQNLMGKSFKANKTSLTDLKIKDLVLRGDGGALLMVEMDRVYVRRSAPMYGMYGRLSTTFPENSTDFYNDDILVFAFHPTGAVHWREILRKKQSSSDDGGRYSSFFLTKTRGSLRFLYNDEVKMPTNVQEYSLNGKGQSERRSLFSTADEKLFLEFKQALQTGASEVFVPSTGRNQFRLVRIRLQN